MRLKRGNVPIDFIVLMVVMVFVISLVVLVADLLNTEFMEATSDTFNQTMLNETTKTLRLFNTGMPFIFFCFILAMLMSAWFLRSTPILSFILIMVVCIVIIISAAISNAWFDVSRSDALAATANNYPYMVYINDTLPMFIGIGLFIVIIYLNAKSKSGGTFSI